MSTLHKKNSFIERAIEISLHAHAGQVDKAGAPYILHPLRLMLKFSTENEMLVSVLHDVIEDSDVTLSDLVKNGFSKEVVKAIQCLTRVQGESYECFIQRISTNELARKIKIEDLKDNMDLSRLSCISEKDLSRNQKYQNALALLMGF